jgi:hypothetical protein
MELLVMVTVLEKRTHKTGRLSVEFTYKDEELWSVGVVRSGEQRDDGAGYISLTLDEAKNLLAIFYDELPPNPYCGSDCMDAVEQQIAAVKSAAVDLTASTIYLAKSGRNSATGIAEKAVDAALDGMEAACRRLVLVARAEMPCYRSWYEHDYESTCAEADDGERCPSCAARGELGEAE